MLHPTDAHPYQIAAIKHVLGKNDSMLWMDMGLGKTMVALTAIAYRADHMQTWGTLVVAPKRVCQAVWRQEAAKWSHLNHLTFSMVAGDENSRKRAIFIRADVYLINYENLVWLQEFLEGQFLSRGKYPPFNQIVFDEISKMKNTRIKQGAKRGRAAKRLRPYMSYAVGLTGTPASNGLLDLFGQYLVIDQGARLGKSFNKYRTRFFYQSDRGGYRYRPFEGAPDRINNLIGDITLSMKNEDYLDLPPFVFNNIRLDLDDKGRALYDEAEREMIVSLDSGNTVDITSEGSKINRCLQIANGAIYLEPGAPEFEQIHDAKLDALGDVLEEAAGSPILVVFEFQHDAHRIQKKYPHAVWISSRMGESEFQQTVLDWNAGLIPLLIGHPGSMGHGLNIQDGGNQIVWFGLNWSFDLYAQTNARLRRQGQTRPVIVHRIIANATVDEVVEESLITKAGDETSIRQAVKRYWEKKNG